jgi:hypothetical protein
VTIIVAVLGDCAPTGAAMKAKSANRSRCKRNRFLVVMIGYLVPVLIFCNFD